MLARCKKSYDKQHIWKQRHYFSNKGVYSQSYGFPVVRYVCESWAITKTENERIDAFELWCWRRLLRVPWTARRPNQSILKEIMWRADSLEKTLMLGKIEGRKRGGNREWDGWMASLTQWTRVWANSGRWSRTGKPGVLQSMGLQRVGHDWATEEQ